MQIINISLQWPVANTYVYIWNREVCRVDTIIIIFIFAKSIYSWLRFTCKTGSVREIISDTFIMFYIFWLTRTQKPVLRTRWRKLAQISIWGMLFFGKKSIFQMEICASFLLLPYMIINVYCRAVIFLSIRTMLGWHFPV